MKTSARLSLTAALLATLTIPANASASTAANQSGSACPDLPRSITLLARKATRTDSTIETDRCGVALFAETTAQASPVRPKRTTGPASVPSSIPSAEAFSLSSRPDSEHTLYLDFTGADLSGTYWATQPGAPSPALASAWDADGNPATFSDAERQAITATWAVVAEDFLPFDVNVTTVEPSADRINRSNDTDRSYGAVMVFTRGNWVQDACGGCSGMAPFGTFTGVGQTADAYRIGLAFPGGLDQISTDTLARTFGSVASHEYGHILGLLHDGLSATNPNGGRREYFAGASGWAPLMGVSGTFEMSRWSNGDYDHASTTQDDLAILTRALGSAADDHPDAGHQATLLSTIGDLGVGLLPTLGSTQPDGLELTDAASGVLETNTDVDAFTATLDRSSILAVAPTWAGNSDLKAEVFRDGARVATLAPVTTWDASARTLSGRDLTYLAEPGQYTILVSADASDTGTQHIASVYGSLGGYTIAVRPG